MDAICQSCGATLDIPYILVGAATLCSACGLPTTPRPVLATRPEDTGYEITFSDFHKLLYDQQYRASIASLLREWYGYEVEAAEGSVRILAGDGREVDELALHRRIQSDSEKQGALYRAAMTLWR